jgi:hypothetical protein
MVRRFLPLLLAAFALCSINNVSAIAQSKLTYQTYHNARFAYSITYPVDVFVPQGESDNGDGQRFLSKDGRAEPLVYAGYATSDSQDTLQKRFREATAGRTAEQPQRVVTYKLIKDDWFVVSGRDGGRIFYQKTIFRKAGGDKPGVFKTLRIEYDEAQNRDYGTIVARLVASFKG